MIKDKVSFCVIGNIVHVRNEYSPEYYNPRYTVHYYPTGINERDFIFSYGKIEDQEFCNASEQFHQGIYQFRVKGYGFRNWNRILLPQLAKTEASKIELIEIPCPKVRSGINTRYKNGYWEKELKTGWCTA
jgi:hypothetical protein